MCSSGIKSPKVADSMSLGHALSVEYKRNVVLVIDLNFVVLRKVDLFISVVVKFVHSTCSYILPRR